MKAHKLIIQASKATETKGNGIIGVNPNKPEYGSIYIAGISPKIVKGFLNNVKLPYYLNGKIEELEAYIDAFGLKAGDDYSNVVEPSRVIIKETFTARHESNNVAINPSTGNALTSGGAEFYRYYDLVAAGSSEQDNIFSRDTEDVSVPATSEAEELAA